MAVSQGLTLTQVSQNLAANTSQVRILWQSTQTGLSHNDYRRKATWRIRVNGGAWKEYSVYYTLPQYSTVSIVDTVLTVTHSDQGKCTVQVQTWMDTDISAGVVELNQSLTLKDIPRASTLAATAAYIEDASTVAVSRKSTGYTHSIHYRFGALSGYIADAAGAVSDTEQKLTATTVVFPIPQSFYQQIPNAPSGVCTLTCRTYSGATQIGSDQTAKFTVTADPARCGPQVSATAEDICQQTLFLTGDSRIIVQGESEVACAVTAQARCGANLAQVLVNGVEIQGGVHRIFQPATAQITVRAVDTRGYSTEYTVPGLSFVPYRPPEFHVAASRTDATSGNGLVALTGKWYSGPFGKEHNEIFGKYRVDSGGWIPFGTNTSGDDVTAQVALTDLDYRTGHTVEVQLTDLLNTDTQTASISKGIPVFDWGEADFRFHVPVSFTATDGSRFSLDVENGELKIRSEV